MSIGESFARGEDKEELSRLHAAELQDRLGFQVSAATSNDWRGAYAIVDFDSLDRLAREVARLTEEREREPLPATPESYHDPRNWFRQKLNASIRHLRDIEDYFRMLGGLPESHNMARADRARDIYEQITEDFFNGKLGQPTFRERLISAEAEVERLRAILSRGQQ